MTPHPHILIVEGLYSFRHQQVLRWNKEQVKRLIYYDHGGSCRPYFSSFIFTPMQSTRKRYFTGLQTAFSPAQYIDWKEWANELFASDCWIHSFQQVAETIDHPPIDIWITLPYPLKGKRYRNQRNRALEQWIDMVVQRWRKQKQNFAVRLQGFVWGREAIPVADCEMVRFTNEIIHHYNLKSMWLPNYRAAHVADSGRLGFDHVAVFSNYTGSEAYGMDWLYNTSVFTGLNKIGIQLVFGVGQRFPDQHVKVYMKAKRVYEGHGGKGPYIFRFIRHSLYECYQQNHGLYDQIYRLLQTSRGWRDTDESDPFTP